MKNYIKEMLKNPSIPVMSDAGILEVINLVLENKNWEEPAVGIAHKITIEHPAQREPVIGEDEKLDIKKKLFEKVVLKIEEAMKKNPNFMAGLKDSFTLLKDATKEDFEKLFFLVKSGKIGDAYESKCGHKIIYEIASIDEVLTLSTGSDLPNLIFGKAGDNDTLIKINTPNGKNTYEFMYQYAENCLERDLSFSLCIGKPMVGGTMILVPSKYLNEHIEILYELKREYPETVEKFGSPFPTAHNQDFFSVCRSRMSWRDANFNALAFETFYMTFSSLILEKFNEELTADQIKDLKENYATPVLKRTARSYEFYKASKDSVDLSGKLLKEYKSFVARLVNGNKNEVIEKFRKILKENASFSEFADVAHADYPIGLPGAILEFVGERIVESSTESHGEPKIFEENPKTFEARPKIFEERPRTFSIADFKKMLSYTPQQLQVRLVILGVPMAQSKGLSEEQLRQKVFEKCSLDNDAIIEILCSDTDELKKSMIGIGFSRAEVASKGRELLEEMLIKRIGIDKVIEANAEATEYEHTSAKKHNHIYENSLQAVRLERGRSVCCTLRSREENSQRVKYFKSLSKYQKEDAETYASMSSSIKYINENFIKLL